MAIKNRRIHLLTSSDGTVTADKNVHIEYRGDLLDLSGPDETTDISDELDEMVITWALHLLTETTNPALSAQLKNEFNEGAKVLNVNIGGQLDG